ncbi:MAG: branched-chain amino acid ABC transporter substrate-binding protein [Bacillota bacterium]
MRKCRWLVLLVVSLLLVTTAVAGCSKPKVIKVASVSPLSGSQSSMGEAIKLGVQMALDENKEKFKALGYDLQFSPQDDQADPKVGVSVAEKLIADKDVLLVVGHLNSNVAIPSSEVYAKDNLTQVSPANTAPAVTDRQLPNVNRVCGRDDFQGPWGARYAAETLKAKSVFVIHDKTTYGQGVADEFRKKAESLGLQVLGFEGITPGEVDFSAVLNQAKVKKPDLIYFGGMYPEAGQILKQAREKKITSYFMGADGIDDKGLIDIAGNDTIGVVYTTAAGDVTKSDVGRTFAANYKAKFGKAVGAYSAQAYDSTNVGLLAIEAAIKAGNGQKPTRAQVSTAVRKAQYTGISGPIAFDSKGDNVNAKIYIFEIKEAKYPGTLAAELAGKP